ncbi:MAG: dicarboxylate/amino acid:cation symporter [Pseudomonadota bacterium]
MSTHKKMLLGFAVGVVAGLVAHFFTEGNGAVLRFVTTYVTGPIGQIFLRALFMLILPLVFSALVMGIVEMKDLRTMGRAGLRLLLYTILFTGTAVVVGMTLVNVLRPGEGFDRDLAESLIAGTSERVADIVESSRQAPSGIGFVVGLVPSNVVGAAASNDILGVMVFALIFGIGIVLTPSSATERLKEVIDGTLQVSMTLIDLVLRFAPYAVACLVFNLAAQFGWGLLVRLASFVGVALLAMVIHGFVFYPLMIRYSGRNPVRFFRKAEEALLVAFSTASSNAALPTTLRVAEERLGLPEKVARFVLTVGATANQNGTALFEGITVLFLAQFYGVDLSLGQQALVMFVCILGGVGTAGVPAGSLPVIAMICGMVGIPVEGIGIILGVDRFLDMCRTTLNVAGDLVITAVIAGPPGNEKIQGLGATP